MRRVSRHVEWGVNASLQERRADNYLIERNGSVIRGQYKAIISRSLKA